MPYYHVYIDRDGDEIEEIDLPNDQLIEHIVGPYNQHRKFLCRGTIIDPSEITTIRIIETEHLSSKLLPQIKAEKAKEGMSAFFASDFELLEDRGRNVTREFIKLRRGRRRRKTTKKKKTISLSKNVFIVHGRDHKPVKELKAMLKEFGLNPIVLHEQPSGSRTIVEKLEKYSDVGYAFVILTPDDIGCLKDDYLEVYKLCLSEEGETENKRKKRMKFFFNTMTERLRNRARQNVILEFGYFIGKLDRDGVSGRDRICCLLKGDVENPSDMHGIEYIPFKESVNEVRDKIIKELKEAGYKIEI